MQCPCHCPKSATVRIFTASGVSSASSREGWYLPKAKAGAREQPITAALAAFLDVYLRESVSMALPNFKALEIRPHSSHRKAL